MWEKDRNMLRAFKECYANLKTSIEAGEEVDLASACVEETEALTNYTLLSIGYYKENTSQEVSEKKQRYYTPKVPYFQNL